MKRIIWQVWIVSFLVMTGAPSYGATCGDENLAPQEQTCVRGMQSEARRDHHDPRAEDTCRVRHVKMRNRLVLADKGSRIMTLAIREAVTARSERLIPSIEPVARERMLPPSARPFSPALAADTGPRAPPADRFSPFSRHDGRSRSGL